MGEEWTAAWWTGQVTRASMMCGSCLLSWYFSLLAEGKLGKRQSGWVLDV